MRSKSVLVLVALAGAATAVVPALAEDQTVSTTSDNTFSPSTVTINVHEKVTFSQSAGAGYHNLHFDGSAGPENQPTFLPWTIVKTFDSAGRFGFYCDIHRGSGMVGTVVVVGPATTTAPPPAAPAVQSLSVSVRGRAIVIKYRLTAATGFTATVDRRPLRGGSFHRYGTLSKRSIDPSGAGSARFSKLASGRRFKTGRYRLRLRATAADGRRSAARTAAFTVRK